MPSDAINRTLVLSVVAVDLVGYSRKSVAEQMSLKDGFNQVLLQAIRDISVADRIILDTGDGVAMGFLGDPEDALYVAMFMHDAINRDSTGSPSGGMDSNAIRIGVNLGPVKLATGAGGHPNIIGDGINVAERIMSFAEPGQLTASRPFYEVMSRLSDHYATLFQFAGVHTDKQVRAHDVYVIGKSAAAFRQAQRGVAERALTRADHPVGGQYVFPPATSSPPSGVVHPAGDTKPLPRAAMVAKPVNKKIESPPAPPNPREPVVPDTNIPAAEPAREVKPASHALIDFLEDRNKVATTATLLVVMAVTLAALLVYRKMPVQVPDNASTVAATSVPAEIRPPAAFPPSVPPSAPAATTKPAPTVSAPVSPTPASAAPVSKSVPDTRMPATTKADVKSAPAIPAAQTATVPAAAPSAAKPSMLPPPPVPTSAPVTAPAKAVERTPPTSGSEMPGSPGLRDKLKDARTDKPDNKVDRVEKIDKGDRSDKTGKTEKGGARDDARKPPVPRSDRVTPSTTLPVVPAYQSPAEAPRPEIVAPTPAPLPPPAPAVDNSIVAILRNDPAYPVEAVRQAIPSGFVRARITIDANGNVSDIVILESRPISAFGRETRQSAKQWKFNRGAAGRTQEIEISFKP